MRARAIMAAATCLVVGALHARPSSGVSDTWMCSTGNTEPVTDCFDWVTGPASSENSFIPMTYLNEGDGAWESGDLWSTDMGCPVTDPAGKELVMMVYGDTYVENKDPGVYEGNYSSCMGSTAAVTCSTGCGWNDPKCMEYFRLFSKSTACEYLCALSKTDNAFYPSSNTVFFAAQADPLKKFGITFGDNLWRKHIMNTAKIEDGSPCLPHSDCPTGVYGYDYFYACPGSLVDCDDDIKLLYIITATVVWLKIKLTTPLAKTVHAMAKDGTGFYKFGTLDEMYTKVNGCRLTFDKCRDDPSYYLPGYYPHCPVGPGHSVQPVHPHHVPYSSPSLVIPKTDNPNVLWGWGTRFTVATPLRGFEDSYDPDGGVGYVYFLGSGELTWENTPTDLIYMARVPASEDALTKGEFEYFRGFSGGETSWGSYNEAKPVFNISGFWLTRLSSAILRDGTWYVAVNLGVDGATWESYGMAVLTSTDGFSWSLADVVEYSNIFGATTASTINVYGHYWVPSVVLDRVGAIPYLFSVWKGILGYYGDFFYEGDPWYPIEAKYRFRDYNTKMYWYYF